MSDLAVPSTPTLVVQLATKVTAAFVSNNAVPVAELPNLIRAIHTTMNSLAHSADAIDAPKPAVPIKKSVTPDFIVCLEDGKKLSMLKRYIRSHYNLTPEEYRARWGLPADYPMVAPNYSARRSDLAKKSGLGHSGKKRKGKRTARQ